MTRRIRAILRIVALLLRGSWRSPRHVDVLLLFPEGNDALVPLIGDASHAILDPRERSINVRVALRCFARGRFGASDYIVEYTRRVRPAVLVTFLDNFWQFYALGPRLVGVRRVAVQNGVRGPSDDVFGFAMDAPRAVTAGWHVDEMCVFGPAVGREYAKYIGGGIRVIGSIRNNAHPLAKPSGPLIGYVSTWRSAVSLEQRVAIHGGTREVTVGEVYSQRDRLVTFLDRHARSRGSRVLIIGKDPTHADRAHYAEVLGHSDFEFSARVDGDASYRAIDRPQIVVFSSSTLGYEALARGRRVAAFFTDIELTRSRGERFGWPLDLPDDGPFWTHRYDEARFATILDDLIRMTEEEWRLASAEIVSELIGFDPNNEVIRDVLQSALAARK